ncbi:glycosyltransferase family 4 protein [Kineococcus esterisolvens]|uniref:glycosyltransferase family 4 protein n=1 Tax=Kineococcus sp. SYSU DK027 TaxID=3383148 RepID=UPI003D7C3B5C
MNAAVALRPAPALAPPGARLRGPRPLRVVLVSDSYLPRLGGIELHVRDLATRLSAAGHDVHVLTATGDLPGAPAAPFAVHRLQPAGVAAPVDPVLWTGADRSAVPGLLAGADVVHAHSSVLSPLAWTAVRQAHRLGVPAVVTVHSMLPRGGALPLAAALSRRRAGAVRWTAVSGAVAAPLRAATGCPVDVLPNGVDPLPWREAVRCSSPGGGGTFTVVTAGRFTARKRPLAMVRALRSVRARVPAHVRLRAVMVGEGPQREAAAAAVVRHGLAGWVELPGSVSRGELARLFAAADAYAAPAVWESFGLAALEARCAGLPVVGMAGSGLAEFVTHGVEGALAADDRDLARVLARWAVDRDEVRRIRRHNTATVPAVTWERVLPAAVAQYEAARSAPLGAVPHAAVLRLPSTQAPLPG